MSHHLHPPCLKLEIAHTFLPFLSFLLQFLLSLTVNLWAVSSNHATAWIHSCLKLPPASELVHCLQIQPHSSSQDTQCSQSLCRGICHTSGPLPSSTLSACLLEFLSSKFLSELPNKLSWKHAGTFPAQSLQRLCISSLHRFQKPKNHKVRFIPVTVPLLHTNFLYFFYCLSQVCLETYLPVFLDPAVYENNHPIRWPSTNEWKIKI